MTNRRFDSSWARRRGNRKTHGERVAQSSPFSNSAVLPITRAAEFLRCETLRYLLLRPTEEATITNRRVQSTVLAAVWTDRPGVDRHLEVFCNAVTLL